MPDVRHHRHRGSVPEGLGKSVREVPPTHGPVFLGLQEKVTALFRKWRGRGLLLGQIPRLGLLAILLEQLRSLPGSRHFVYPVGGHLFVVE